MSFDFSIIWSLWDILKENWGTIKIILAVVSAFLSLIVIWIGLDFWIDAVKRM